MTDRDDSNSSAAAQPNSAALFIPDSSAPSPTPFQRVMWEKKPYAVDFILDLALAAHISGIRRSGAFKARPHLRILAVGVQSPRRPGALDAIFDRMRSHHHEVVFDQKSVEDKGKLENTNILLARHDLSTFDWVWTVDDDVALPRHFTDIFMALAEGAQLKIAAPAHRRVSYYSYPVTARHRGALVRETSCVEVGPIAAFRRETFADIFPLPVLRYGWGLDLVWPMIARRRGWRMGIVDAVPLRHLNPVAATYDREAAITEARAYMDAHGFIPSEDAWQTLRTWEDFPIRD